MANRAMQTKCDKPRICWVFNSSSPILVPSEAFTRVDWDTVILDDFGGFNLAAPGVISLPTWAEWVYVKSHATFSPQMTVGAIDGVARQHLWRNGAPTTDAHYHTTAPYRANYNPANGWLASFFAEAPWIPVKQVGETWELDLWQNTGKDADVQGGIEIWLYVAVK